MYSLSLQAILFHFVAALIVAPALGWTLATLARAFGDPGPSHDGRRTANPLAHLGLLGFLGFLGYGVGWVRPIDIAPSELVRGRWMIVVVVFSSCLALMALWYLFTLLEMLAVLRLQGEAALAAAALFATLADASLASALLNLIPVPPLAGGVMLRMFPVGWVVRMEKAAGWIGAAVLLGLWSGVLELPLNLAQQMVEAIFGR